MSQTRLQKFLANAGIASRRKAEELIAGGRVGVNGTIVTELGTKIDPAVDRVTVDGKRVESSEPVWIALHKPRGYVSTRNDPQKRRTIYDLLPSSLHGLFYVGRLDADSEGLMLLTNAGDEAHRLLHPKFQVPRVYEVVVEGEVSQPTLQRLLAGVELDDGPARAETAELLTHRGAGQSRVRLMLREGRKREVRRLMSAVGHDVRRLRRVRYGPIELGDLEAGKWRRLSDDELEDLKI